MGNGDGGEVPGGTVMKKRKGYRILEALSRMIGLVTVSARLRAAAWQMD